MQIAVFLIQLRDLGIELRAEDGKLKVSAPKGAMTAELKRDIGARKEEILAFLARSQQALNTSEQAMTIQPTAVGQRHPLSLGQERLWQLAQLASDAAVYNIPYAFRLNGPLNIDALAQSFQTIVDRHDVLRTTFTTAEEGGDTAVQEVAPSQTINLQHITLSDMPAEQQQAESQIYLGQYIAQPFDLGRGPLHRFVLITLNDEEHLLLTVFHHLIFDGWSADVLWQELATAYNAYQAGDEPLLPDLPIQYADYALWQQAQLEEGALAQELAYWQEKLAGQPETLALPAKQSCNLTQRNAGQMYSFRWDTAVSQQLKQFGHTHKASSYMVLLTLLNIVLNRTTGQEDLLIASPIAGRQQNETEPLIGYFNNIIVLRHQLTNDPTTADLLHQVRGTVLEAQENQMAPFHRVANMVNISLTRAFFTLEDSATAVPLDLHDLSVTPIELAEDTADFDLAIFMQEQDDQFTGTIWYKSALFDQATIEQLVHNWQTVAEAVAANGEQSLSQLPSFADQYQPVAPATQARTTPTAVAEDDVERQLVAIWQDLLGLDDIGVTDNFFDLGGHSMLAVRLFNRIQQELTDEPLPLATLLTAPTIRQLAAVVRQDDATPHTWSSLVPIQPEGDQTPIFCVHGAGGNVLLYKDLAKHLGPNQPVYGLQSRGLDGQQPFLDSVEEMAAYYLEEIQTVQPHGPYHLLGYCLGGTIALEMAQRLVETGEKVTFLGLLETYNWANAKDLSFFESAYSYAQKVEFHWRNFNLLDRRGKKVFLDEKLKVVKDRSNVWLGSLKSVFKKDGEDTTDQDQLLSALWQHNDRVAIEYVPRPYPGRITHFCPLKEYADLNDPALGWDDIALDGVERHTLPVYPAGMLVEPFVAQLATLIDSCITEALPTETNIPHAQPETTP